MLVGGKCGRRLVKLLSCEWTVAPRGPGLSDLVDQHWLCPVLLRSLFRETIAQRRMSLTWVSRSNAKYRVTSAWELSDKSGRSAGWQKVLDYAEVVIVVYGVRLFARNKSAVICFAWRHLSRKSSRYQLDVLAELVIKSSYRLTRVHSSPGESVCEYTKGSEKRGRGRRKGIKRIKRIPQREGRAVRWTDGWRGRESEREERDE